MCCACLCRGISLVSSFNCSSIICYLSLHLIGHEDIAYYTENLMNKLMSMNCIPTFLWNNDHLLQYIQNVFHENDNSIVGVVRRLKTELSHYFSLPGMCGISFDFALLLSLG